MLEAYPQNITGVIPRSRHCVLGASKIKEVKHPKFRCCFWLCGCTKLKNAIWWQLYLLTVWWNQCSACVPVACKFTLVADGNDTSVKTWKAVSEQPYFKKRWQNAAANNLKVNVEPVCAFKHTLQCSVPVSIQALSSILHWLLQLLTMINYMSCQWPSNLPVSFTCDAEIPASLLSVFRGPAGRIVAPVPMLI